MNDDTEDGKKRRQVNVWLTHDEIVELDTLAASQTKGASQVTRSSLVRSWVERGLREAKRAR